MTEPTTVAADDATPGGAADPAWAKALTLAERAALGQPPGPGGDRERAERRLARWRRAHDLAEGDGLRDLLSTVPGGEDRLLALLAEPAEDLAARAGGASPLWWSQIHDAAAAATTPADAGADGDWRHAFAVILAPIAHQALTKLAARVRADPRLRESIESRPVLTSFLGHLNGLLVSTAARTLILELNVLRELGRLAGATPGERFGSFVGQFTEPGVQRAFFTEYPVLARMLVQRAENASEATWELLCRWAADRDLIRDGLFDGSDPGRLTSIAGGAGDTHRGGRSVAVLTFSGGRQAVYKPRSQAGHTCFNALLQWLDARLDLDLRTLTVLDRGDYGWLEYAEHSACQTPGQVRRYYRRLGAQLALLHAVNGADFHFENLIACGDQPVLVDLEALFHQPSPTAADSGADRDPALQELERSVMRTGLLPILVSTEQGSIDIGGLGGDPRDVSPFASAAWEGGGTDTMRVVREHLPFPGARNRPSIDGAETDLALHIPAVLGGFRDAYRAIVDGSAELTAAGGIIETFADVEVRMILRPTQMYATLAQEGTHPDLLRDALDGDRHFSFLWAVSAGVPGLVSVVPSELSDLWSGDVPLFTTRPGSRDLHTSRGVAFADYFAVPGLDRVRTKLASFGERDLALQEWTVRAALQARNSAFSADTAPLAHQVTITDRVAPTGSGRPAAALETATAIAEHLVLRASTDSDRVGWLGLEAPDEKGWRVSPIGWDLYSGASGVALFLDAAADLTGRSEFREYGQRALWQIPAVLDALEGLSPEDLAGRNALHGFAGLPGLAYALLHLRDETAAVERLVRLSSHLLGNSSALDVMSGAAGAVACLLAIHAATGLAEPLDLARRNGELLLAAAEPVDSGLAWTTIAGALQPIVGFAHGAGGIAWALVRLGAATGDDRFVAAGLAGFGYERAQYRADWRNWPDFRPISLKGAAHMHAWCHGAPGIGLARIDVAALTDDPAIGADLELAVASTLAQGFGRSHSLCHGDLGNLELLLVAGHEDVGTVGAGVLASIAERGPQCGTPGRTETPGLMAGLAGVGHGLLRLHAPDAVPSLLLMRPPLTRPPSATAATAATGRRAGAENVPSVPVV
ncbi:MAG: type 2 lantipeptide synthetase LanM [Catenulispora sp.]|nr:type 2 lantipeptide synthetase LanM [Catenulispora sp.]